MISYYVIKELQQHSQYNHYGMGCGVWDSAHTKARDLSLLKNIQTRCGNQPVSYSMGIGDSVPRGNVAEASG